MTTDKPDTRRDDLLFQSAKSDGEGGFVPVSPLPSRDEVVRELCRALEATKLVLSAYQAQGAPHEYVGSYSLRKLSVLVDAALRRARGQ